MIDQTVDIKSRVIKEDNIMTYDYLVKNKINSKRIVEIIIYAPPCYLSEEFLKTLEKKYSTELRNSLIQSNENNLMNTDFVFYHINMHNFRVLNKIEENKYVITFGLNSNECEKSLNTLNEKMKNPLFFTYSTNRTLLPFLTQDESSRKDVMNYFVKSSIEFVENSKKYIGDRMKCYEKFEENNVEIYLKEIDENVKEIDQWEKDLNFSKIEKDFNSFSIDEDVNKMKSKSNSAKIKQDSGTFKNNYRSNKFIKLAGDHTNPFACLKEIFLKEEKIIGYGVDFKESSGVFKLKSQKEIVVLVPMTIPGTGKTLFVDMLKEILTKLDIAFDSISSDQIRRELMDELVSKNRMDKQTAFNKTGKSSVAKFESELKKKFKNLVVNFDRSLLYIDKNHPPNALSRVFEPINEVMRELNKNNQSYDISVKFVSLLGDCAYPITLSENLHVPFSLSYFLQCYVRIKHRTNHQTLNGDNKELICILGMFVNNFMNFALNEENLILRYHFNHAIKLPFTNEFSEEKINSELVASAKDYLKNLPRGNSMPLYDQNAAKFEDLINKYYQTPESFVSTRELVKSTAGPMVKKLFSISEGDIKKDETSKKVPNDITALPLPLAPSNFIYLGLVISGQIDKMINQVFMQAVMSFLKLDSNSIELAQMSKTLANNHTLPNGSWKFPHKDECIWHSTTFYKGNKAISTCSTHAALKEFIEGKVISLSIKAIVYVPGKLMTCYINTSAYVDNKFPHITLALCGMCAPKESNNVLNALFEKGCVLEKEFNEILKPKDNTEEYLRKVEIKLEGKNVNCFVVKLNPPVRFEAKMRAF